jgi:CBS domain-containing protein
MTENKSSFQTVEDVMNREVISVSPETGINEVAQELARRSIHGVPVVDKGNHVLGIITEADFFIKEKSLIHLPSFIDIMQKLMVRSAVEEFDRREAEKILAATAENIMMTPCVTVYPQTTMEELLAIFEGKHFKSIPVVNKENVLVGIVTLFDLLPYLSVKK